MLARLEEVGLGVKRERVPDSLLKLPDFSYDPVSKEEFLSEFRLMCKAINGEYLLTNELRRFSDGMRVDGQHPPQQTTEPIQIFSPSLERRREAYATMDDDPYARVEGSRTISSHSAESAATQQSSVVWRGPAVQAPHTQQAGLSSQPVFDQSPPQTQGASRGATYQTPPPFRGPTILPAAPQGAPSVHSVPISASAAPLRSSMPYVSSFGSHPPDPQARYPDRIHRRQTVPDHLQLSHMGAPGPPRHDDSDVVSVASAVTAETVNSSHDSTPGSDIAGGEVDDDGASAAGSVHSDGKYGQPMGAVPDPSPRDMGSDLRRETARAMADSHAYENEQLRQQIRRLEQMMASMNNNIQRAQSEQQASLALVANNQFYQGRGVEDWVVQERLNRDFRSPYGFWWVTEQRWENPQESMLRSRVYLVLKKKLPSELIRGTIENDVRTVWINVVRINTGMAADQVVVHMRSLLKMHKGSQPMLTWLNNIYHKVDCSRLSTSL